MSKRNIVILGLLLCLFISGCSIPNPFSKKETKWNSDAFMRVGDTQIDYHEALVYLDASRTEYEKYYGQAIWDFQVGEKGETLQEKVKARVLEDIVYIKLVCSKAAELNVTLTNDEMLQVDQQTAAYMAKIDNELAASRGINKETVHKVYADNALAKKVFEQATLNIDTNIPTEEAQRHHLYSIAIRKYKIGSDGVRAEYSDSEKQDILKRMQNLLKEAKAAKNFLNYATSVTEAAEYLDFYVGKEDVPEGAEEALLLADKTISQIVEAKDYFFIFYCVAQLDLDATLAKKEEIILERQKAAFEKVSNNWRDSADIEINQRVWNSLKLK